ncbi:MarR family winged helix-turn-helix transcriptional regulator [Pseudomonas citronellolis]|uniref:MarR family winged helix-turn-helix transcriptional regulator n=1 Tax=Pseudomonas TaxID=286 RepID=UPI000E2E634A|nr:MarR family winged helix-turn-helix transcriptional regulator [Pseudomonas citronellolis]MCP1604933.1 MarR family transcriptional regulator for hemolysin [Pseudomonas citronellolis]MCP1655828.1 MarR family transcriptional regulator for hemolysin [Pseudomonas citronellolis]MCP1722878.1 MarR family transcriptional regulator for hemolysin [Pseudomonas citronellolis]MDN6876248.1 MarR family winged helix-turn-helix transcriptional regulator [Pseudomonas citronellolis]GBL57179.1 marR family trans
MPSPPQDHLFALTGSLQPARRAWQQAASLVLAESGLSLAVATPVLLVSRMGDGVLQNVLADCIGVHPAALVRTLDQAEAAGLLERHMVPGNRRLRAIHLQDAGRELAERLEKALNALRAEVLGSIPREDVETATRVLRLMEEKARAYAQQKPADA